MLHIPNLIKTGLVILEKILIHNKPRIMHGHRHQPTALGHLSVLGDLKKNK